METRTLTKWRGNVLCAYRTRNDKLSAQNRPTIKLQTSETCPTGYYACPSNSALVMSDKLMCIASGELCPISLVKFSNSQLSGYNCTFLSDYNLRNRTNINYMCISREGTAVSAILEITMQLNSVCSETAAGIRSRKSNDIRLGNNGYSCGKENIFFSNADNISEANMYLDNIPAVTATFADLLIDPVSINKYDLSLRYGILNVSMFHHFRFGMEK